MGRWSGAIKTGADEVSFQVEFRLSPPPSYSSSREEILEGSIDIPQRLVRGAELKNIRFDPPALHFEALGPVPSPTAIFDGGLKGNQLSGTYKQGATRGTFILTRIKTSK